ncbi:unnamed protein product [Calicophoron daubneyi]|uniref:Palmitoyltransferase n=1 Tax=Calicophoron daubneyi TaxID=300641 RepID=A0AAV2TES5_CALDB
MNGNAATPIPDLNESVCCTWQQKFKRCFHWGPLAALGTIFFIAYVSLRNLMWVLPPGESLLGGFHLLAIIVFLYLILHSYFCALLFGPGYVPLGWRPSDPKAENKLQFCRPCNGYKPPRSHHCTTCKRCVLKMDHHCPWINTCCGHLNHGHFIIFLIVVPFGCTVCNVVLGLAAYEGWCLLPYLYQQQSNFMLTIWGLLASIFALGLSVGVTFAVGFLCVVQLKAISKNETGIESWIVTKADHWRAAEGSEQFCFPYDLGRWRNIAQVLSWSGQPIGDGFHWPLREGCGEYDLTLEQIHQKRIKQLARRNYLVTRPYNGRCCPCYEFGFRAGLNTPCCDEPRLKIRPGDLIHVTRWTRTWLYGEISVHDKGVANGSHATNTPSRPRGWFPRKCAVEADHQFGSDKGFSSRLKQE